MEWADAVPDDLDLIDPFFESLGAFDPHARRILLYQKRCLSCATRFRTHWMTVVRVVTTHFCSHAVTLLGVHPKTGRKYIGAGNPGKMFKNEPYASRVAHHYYGELIREEELFAQIFAYLWIYWNAHPGERRVFNLLSAGHADLYSLVPNGYVHPLLFRHWKELIEGNQVAAAREAAHALAIATRGVPVSRGTLAAENVE